MPKFMPGKGPMATPFDPRKEQVVERSTTITGKFCWRCEHAVVFTVNPEPPYKALVCRECFGVMQP
jgi:hypothetical protein